MNRKQFIQTTASYTIKNIGTNGGCKKADKNATGSVPNKGEERILQ